MGLDQIEFSVGHVEFMEMSDSSAKKEDAKSPADRLKDLKELLDLGAISQEEYNSKKTAILNEL